MKKAISLLVALAATFSLVMTGYAADDGIEDMGEPGIAAHLEWAQGSTDDKPLVTAKENDLVLSLGTSSQLILPETHLTPGTEYEYKIYRVTASTAGQVVSPENLEIEPLTDGDLNGGKLRLRTGKGSSAISSIKIEKKGAGVNATYNLAIETKATYGTTMNDVEYSLVVSGQPADSTYLLNTSNISFEVGYREMDDDEIDSYDEGDIVTVYQDTPVFTKKQLERLAKNFNYKAVEFADEDGEWNYTGRISGMGATNFVTSYDVIPSIVNALPDQDFKFLTFQSGVTFPTNGEMRIDVADISDDFTKIYAYLYRNNTLTPINTTYDSTTDEVAFRTSYLGAFVLTDVEITDTDILDPGTEPGDTDDKDKDNNQGGNNPDTGAARGANAAAALALASLATAVVIRKRK